jgi:universal stress protein E
MQVFHNILVGVDLAQCDPRDDSQLTSAILEPVSWSIQLAKVNAARLLFFSASNGMEQSVLPFLEGNGAPTQAPALPFGNRMLHGLVLRAKEQGVAANSKIVPGEGWHEIIRQVLRDQHDLVVAGMSQGSSLSRFLFGSTAQKLLRSCPCPVLVTRPPTFASGILGADAPSGSPGDTSPLNILVPTNLQPSSEEALRLGIDLALQMKACLHLLHVVEYELHEVCNIGLPDARQARYRSQVRAQAEEALQAQLERTAYKQLGSRLQVHLAGDVDLPDVAIQRFIESHQIHLVVMTTSEQDGLPGRILGSTVERLLPEVSCSVLAIKEPGFVCPVADGQTN